MWPQKEREVLALIAFHLGDCWYLDTSRPSDNELRDFKYRTETDNKGSFTAICRAKTATSSFIISHSVENTFRSESLWSGKKIVADFIYQKGTLVSIQQRVIKALNFDVVFHERHEERGDLVSAIESRHQKELHWRGSREVSHMSWTILFSAFQSVIHKAGLSHLSATDALWSTYHRRCG